MKNKPKLLELFEGCFGKQRNGNTVGPLEYDELGMITHKSILWWYPSGRFSRLREGLVDIIEIIPAPEKLPEPFECWAIITDKGEHFCTSHEDNAFNNNAPTDKVFRCTVTPHERVK